MQKITQMTHTELKGIYHELAFWQQFVKTDRFLNGFTGQMYLLKSI